MKRKLTDEEFDALTNKDIKGEYEKQDGGGYTLRLDDDPAEGLRRAKQNEVAEHAKTREALKELQDRFAEMDAAKAAAEAKAAEKAQEAARKNGDVAAIEKSYQDKIEAITAEHAKKSEALTGTLRTLLVDNQASELAAKLTTSPKVLLPHIKSRLALETGEGGEFNVRVLDHEGRPSAATLADLEKEIVADKDFAPLLTGSRASGGGAGAGGKSGGAESTRETTQNVDLSKLKAAALVERIKSRKAAEVE